MGTFPPKTIATFKRRSRYFSVRAIAILVPVFMGAWKTYATTHAEAMAGYDALAAAVKHNEAQVSDLTVHMARLEGQLEALQTALAAGAKPAAAAHALELPKVEAPHVHLFAPSNLPSDLSGAVEQHDAAKK